MNFKILFGLVAIGLAGCATTNSALSESPKYIGMWDCGISEFTFTPTHYRVLGMEPIAIKNVENSTNDYFITMVDGYRISLFDVSPKTMIWHSLSSGDTFDCKKIM